MHELPREIQDRALVGVEIPVDPADVVVLAVRIVVPALGSTQFVAVADHRHALRQEQRGQEVAFLPLAKRTNLRVVGVPSVPPGFDGIACFPFLNRFTYGNFGDSGQFGLEG